MLVSVVIRTLNEDKYLDELLTAVAAQKSDLFQVETVIVDSGSTDKTLEISRQHGARITHIRKENFSFGRSLNIGCDFANGEILAFVSGHCVPASDSWLHDLCLPIHAGKAQYTYGKQIGRDTTKFSERQVFEKYFPNTDMIPQEGFFCNNANSAILRSEWEKHRFDEELTGLEDMELAQRLVKTGGHIGYVANAGVFHIHNEPWNKVKIRYEREAIALQKIMPEVHVSILDVAQCIITSIYNDLKAAAKQSIALRQAGSIIAFRCCQFWGAYVGNHNHRKLSNDTKRKYFYPNEKVAREKPRQEIL